MAAIQNLIMAEGPVPFPPPQQLPVMQANGMAQNAAFFESAGQSPPGSATGNTGATPVVHGVVMVLVVVVLALVGSVFLRAARPRG